MIICDTCGEDVTNSRERWIDLSMTNLTPDMPWIAVFRKKYPTLCRSCFDMIKVIFKEELQKTVEDVTEKIVERIKLKELGK